MRKLVVGALMALFSCLALAGSIDKNQLRMTHNNNNTPSDGTRTVYIPVPPINTECMLTFWNNNNTTYNSQCRAITSSSGIVVNTSTGEISVAPAWSSITGAPTTMAGYGITDGVSTSTLSGYVTSAALSSTLSGYVSGSSLTATLTGYATQTDLSTGLANKMNVLSGTTSQYVRGDGTLAGFPSIPAAQVQADWAQASSGAVDFIKNKPALGSAAAANLPASGNAASGEVVTGADTRLSDARTPTAHTHAAADIVSGTLADARIPALAISKTTGLQSALDAKQAALTLTTTGSGAPTLVGATLNIPPGGSGTVTSITAGTGLSGGTITGSGTISMPNVGTTGTYTRVTTDAQGRVTSGQDIGINDAPGRGLVTSTTATGFQVSATRPAYVCYEGQINTTSTIGGPASGSIFIETASTNSTTAGDWTKIAEQTASNTITLAVVLQQVDGEPWSLCRMIPAGKYVRVRSQNNGAGTVGFTINTTQQEALL